MLIYSLVYIYATAYTHTNTIYTQLSPSQLLFKAHVMVLYVKSSSIKRCGVKQMERLILQYDTKGNT